MGRTRVLALALVLSAGCMRKPKELFGERMPRLCAGRGIESERCLGWISDRIVMAMAYRAYPDPELAHYVDAVGARVSRASGDRGGWTFRVIDDPSPQATARLGHVIYVHRGAIALLRDEAELAGLLAHEIGHVVAGHVHGASSSRTVQDERDDEIQADELAVQLVARAGYDPRGVERMLRALATVAPDAGTGDDARHPPWPERIARVQATAARLPATGSHDDRALRRLLPNVVIGPDPRDHAVVGRALVFARLGLAVDFPIALDGDAVKMEDGAIQVALGGDVNVDLRVVPNPVASYITEDKDLAVVQRRVGAMSLVLSGSGNRAHVHMLGSAIRAARPDELAQIHPRYVDLSKPRTL